MRKVLVIGCPGAGKSTFARALSASVGLPLFYLDMLWHRPDRNTAGADEFDSRLEELLRGERWIIDGNYLRTLERRLGRCDTVFLLDYPTELCLESVCGRIGLPREDMPWVETELDEDFRRWILDFPRDQLPVIYSLLEKYRPGREIHVFRTRAEAEGYLGSLGPPRDWSTRFSAG